LPLIAGLGLDTYLIARLILVDEEIAMIVAGGVSMTLLCLWYGLLSGAWPSRGAD